MAQVGEHKHKALNSTVNTTKKINWLLWKRHILGRLDIIED
jgi:hypothetical protein